MAKAQHATRYRRLPALLRDLREAAGLTQRELAGRLGVNHVSVHKSETGERRVDVTEFLDWARACKVDPVEVFRQLADGITAGRATSGKSDDRSGGKRR